MTKDYIKTFKRDGDWWHRDNHHTLGSLYKLRIEASSCSECIAANLSTIIGRHAKVQGASIEETRLLQMQQEDATPVQEGMVSET